jgi:hypothetical protein
VRSWASATAQHFLVGAPTFVQGIGQLWHPLEGSVVVDRLGQFHHAGRQPDWIDGDLSEGLWAKNVPHQACLGKKFASLRAEGGIAGNSGLGASCSISGSYFWVRGGCIPGCLSPGSLTSKASGTQFIRAEITIGEVLGCFDRITTEIVDQGPNAPRTSDSEQT